MFYHTTSLLPARRRARVLVLGALLLTTSALCLTGCGGSKPAENAASVPNVPAGAPAGASAGSGAALAPDASTAKDQAVQKETAGEKNPEGGGGN